MLVIGVGDGLGRTLIEQVPGFSHRIAVSRSCSVSIDGVMHIQSDALAFPDKIASLLPQSISLVVYVPSAWGESGDIIPDEFDEFMDTGPRGFLSVFHSLKEESKMKRGCLVVSIGSIASESALSANSGTSYPLYSLSKLTQKSLVVQLARQNPEYRFANITLGSIEGETGMGYSSVARSVEYLHSMPATVSYADIQLASIGDMK